MQNRFETKKRQFKKGTVYSFCITFLIFLCIQSCYPGVLQDVIAENKHVKEKVSKVDFKGSIQFIYFCKKKSCPHMRTSLGRIDTTLEWSGATGVTRRECTSRRGMNGH